MAEFSDSMINTGKSLGDKIKYYRKKRGYTQETLAKMTGFSKMSIRRYETGERQPRYGAVQEIANALDCPIKMLIEDLNSFPREERAQYLIYGGQLERTYDKLMQLTVEARRKVYEYVDDMWQIPKYRIDKSDPNEPPQK